MRLRHCLYTVPLILFAACTGDDLTTNPATDDGEVELLAGIVEGGASATTRAGAEDFHGTHRNLAGGTKLALQVSGTWTGHGDGTVVQTTTATVGAATGLDNKHNSLSCSPVLYWDDYGTADPDNLATGRAEGLTIFGAAVNGKDTVPTIANWQEQGWVLPANQSLAGNTPTDKDLLISNNVQAAPSAATSNDGTYKFAERAAGKLLEFRHALSKVTVNLLAGEGFDGSFTSTTVELTSNEAHQNTNTEWPRLSGKVNITTGAPIATGGNALVTMAEAETPTSGYTVTKEALVHPGSEFAADAAIIARINADGNIYYVTAEKIRTAINAATHATDGAYSTEAGKNYILNVTVNKTAIEVTAAVTDWITVESENVAPKIKITVTFGNPENIKTDEFSFYRSTQMYVGYGSDQATENDLYKPDSRLYHDQSTNTWTWETQRYWSSHNTHYQFRMVWPRATTDPTDLTHPHVRLVSGDSPYQGIAVKNVPYVVNSHPSDLMIARPDVTESDYCVNDEPGHTRTNLYTGGICATEGNINLTFKYMMSQVEVNLLTTNTNSAVSLDNAVVEIVNVYNNGDVKLGDRTVVPTGSTGTYTLDAVSGTGNENKRLSAIVPQELTYTEEHAETNVRFRITIDNGDGTTDVYYADVAPIKKANGELVAPNGEWESGYHYVYNLLVSKTAISVSATLAEWTPLEASDDVWF